MPTSSVNAVPLEEVIPTNSYAVVNGSLTSGEFEMQPGMFNLSCTLTVNADTIVYLPPIANTVGSLYTVYVIAVDAGNKVTVKGAKTDPVGVFADSDLTAAESYILVLNTGDKWKVLNSRL